MSDIFNQVINSFANPDQSFLKENETYMVNGKYFHSYEDVIGYADSLGLRVTNTETVRKNFYLITIGK